MMKLIDLLTLMDDYSDLIIWEYGTAEDSEPLYKGSTYGVPWHMANMYVVKGLDDNTCAIRVAKDDKGFPVMGICVSDSQLSSVEVSSVEGCESR